MNSMKGVSNTSIAYGLPVASIADARNTGRDGEKTASAAVAGRDADSSVLRLDPQCCGPHGRVDEVAGPERDVPRDDPAVDVPCADVDESIGVKGVSFRNRSFRFPPAG